MWNNCQSCMIHRELGFAGTLHNNKQLVALNYQFGGRDFLGDSFISVMGANSKISINLLQLLFSPFSEFISSLQLFYFLVLINYKFQHIALYLRIIYIVHVLNYSLHNSSCAAALQQEVHNQCLTLWVINEWKFLK